MQSERQPLHPLMSLPVDSPASPTLWQGKEKPARTSATFGRNFTGLFASLGRNGSWLRTCWDYLAAKTVTSSVEYLGTWPKRGTMRNGHVYALPMWERHTSENASSLWRTPQAHDAKSSKVQAGYTTDLTHQVNRSWPTPTTNDARNATLPPSQQERDGMAGTLRRSGHQGSLNPSWVEVLMGFPSGWTDIDGLVGLEKSSEIGSRPGSPRSDCRIGEPG